MATYLGHRKKSLPTTPGTLVPEKHHVLITWIPICIHSRYRKKNSPANPGTTKGQPRVRMSPCVIHVSRKVALPIPIHSSNLCSISGKRKTDYCIWVKHHIPLLRTRSTYPPWLFIRDFIRNMDHIACLCLNVENIKVPYKNRSKSGIREQKIGNIDNHKSRGVALTTNAWKNYHLQKYQQRGTPENYSSTNHEN